MSLTHYGSYRTVVPFDPPMQKTINMNYCYTYCIIFQTPGPGSYKMIVPSVYMNRDPAYSLAGRFEVIVDKSVKPGPGAYYPEKV